jgi:thymidylate synthase
MILTINAQTPAQAWRKCLLALYQSSAVTDGRKEELFRDQSLALTVSDVAGERHDDRFPLSRAEIDTINAYLVTGEREKEVVHEWTKKYRLRLFVEHNQIQAIIEYLAKKPYGKKAQASVWKQDVDINANIAPCLQTMWFQMKDDLLELHVHMRASDCYGKLLMNINEFVALQQFVADELKVSCGAYCMFVDTLHFRNKDRDAIEKLVSELEKEKDSRFN